MFFKKISSPLSTYQGSFHRTIIFAFALLCLISLNATAQTTSPFVTTWVVGDANFGDGDLSITIPTNPDFASSYSYTVDWGDGNMDTGLTGDAEHTYATAGTYEVSITGTFPAIYLNNGDDGSSFNSDDDANKIRTIKQWGTNPWASMENAFAGCSNLDIEPGAGNPVLSGVPSMEAMFEGAEAFNGGLSDWDVSSVTDMRDMFQGANVFNGDLSDWDVSRVTNMRAMFGGADAFNGDLSGWDVSRVTSMEEMFDGAAAFNSDLSGWNVSRVTDMSEMFDGAAAFNSDLSGWNVSRVTNMSAMFGDITLSTANYDALLVGWSTIDSDEGVLQRRVFFDGGNSRYCTTGEAARNVLTGTPNNWSITDGRIDTSANCATVAFTGPGSIADQIYIVGNAVNFILPRATLGTPDYAYTLTGNIPTGLIFDEGTRALTGMPTVETAAVELTYIVTDESTTTTTDILTFNVTVISAENGGNSEQNSPPTTIGLVDQEADVGQELNFQIPDDAFSDPDEDSLTYESDVHEDSWLDFDSVGLTFSGIPVATDRYIQVGRNIIEVTATDSSGESISTSFELTVKAPANIADLVLFQESDMTTVVAVQVGVRYRADAIINPLTATTVTFSVASTDNTIIDTFETITTGRRTMRPYTVPDLSSNSSPSHVIVEVTADVGANTTVSHSVHYPFTNTRLIDNDNDGVPNSIADNASTALRITSQTTETTRTMVVPQSHDIRLGNLARVGMIYSAQLNSTVLMNAGIENPPGYADEGIYDFVVHLPVGERAYVVIPLANPISSYKIWGKWDGERWRDFTQTTGDQYYSAVGIVTAGSLECPPPGRNNLANWAEGLLRGYQCVQLAISDGGFNDADGEANGIVVDPGAPLAVEPRRGNSGAIDLWFILLLVLIHLVMLILRRTFFCGERRLY